MRTHLFQALSLEKLKKCLSLPAGDDDIDIALSDDSDIEILDEACPLSDGAHDLSEAGSEDADEWSSGSESNADASDQTGALSTTALRLQPGPTAAGSMAASGPPSLSRPFLASQQQYRGNVEVAAPLAARLMSSENQQSSQAGAPCSSQALQHQSAAQQHGGDVSEPAALEPCASHAGDGGLDGFMDSGEHSRPC